MCRPVAWTPGSTNAWERPGAQSTFVHDELTGCEHVTINRIGQATQEHGDLEFTHECTPKLLIHYRIICNRHVAHVTRWSCPERAMSAGLVGTGAPHEVAPPRTW